ncbi:unnamed protein product [Ixodes persulcatus]
MKSLPQPTPENAPSNEPGIYLFCLKTADRPRVWSGLYTLSYLSSPIPNAEPFPKL